MEDLLGTASRESHRTKAWVFQDLLNASTHMGMFTGLEVPGLHFISKEWNRICSLSEQRNTSFSSHILMHFHWY